MGRRSGPKMKRVQELLKKKVQFTPTRNILSPSVLLPLSLLPYLYSLSSSLRNKQSCRNFPTQGKSGVIFFFFFFVSKVWVSNLRTVLGKVIYHDILFLHRWKVFSRRQRDVSPALHTHQARSRRRSIEGLRGKVTVRRLQA